MSKELRKFRHEIFLDRTHGKRMGAILRGAGFKVHPIFEVYPGTQHEWVADPTWIKLCAANNWIAITGDKRLETVPENRQAVIDAKARIFLLSESNSPPEVWAAAIIIGHYKMDDILEANSGPFFVNINKRSDTHVGKLRYPPGYQPNEVAEPPNGDGFALTPPGSPTPLLTAGEVDLT